MYSGVSPPFTVFSPWFHQLLGMTFKNCFLETKTLNGPWPFCGVAWKKRSINSSGHLGNGREEMGMMIPNLICWKGDEVILNL